MKAVVFDAYGTLFDVHSAMQRYAARLGPAWQDISQTWRAKHVEYSLVRTLTGHHRSFDRLMREALEFSASKHGIDDPALLNELELAYRALDAFADVVPTLMRLRGMGLRTAILSNGEPDMLDDGVRHAGLDGLLDAVLAISPLGAFKPLPRVYTLATEHFGLAPGDVAFLSSNAWDAFGAHSFGMRVFWVNRSQQPDEYDLAATVPVLSGLDALPTMLT